MSSQHFAPPVRADDKPSSPSWEVKGDDVYLYFKPRTYRIRGVSRNQSLQQLRVNVLARHAGLVHLDTLDLYKASARASFIKAAASELCTDEATVKRELGQILLRLEQLQLDQIEAATAAEESQVELTEAQRREALQFLRDGKLVERILADFDRCGLVGEGTNKLLCYLACVSRLLPSPLAVLIQSSSAAGKTSLMDATLAFMPPEQQVRYSAMTGQSLYYMGRHDLKHKVLAVAEEEGISQASYALKLLQSDGCLRIATAGKSQANGRQSTKSYEVEGPVMMFLTTTQALPDEELRNRCLTLHVNESPEQTASIQARQREAYTLAGRETLARRVAICERHQNAQRLLARFPVVIPDAPQLAFRNDQIHTRRAHARYLSLIASITLLHQHQRKRQPLPQSCESLESPNESREYLEASVDDVRLANWLMTQLMDRPTDDLLPQTRQLLVKIDQFVAELAEQCGTPALHIRFTQRQVRDATGWGDFAVRRHLARLVELEYVVVFRTGRGNQREYQLLHHHDCGSGLDQANVHQLSPGLVDAPQLPVPRSPNE